MSVLYSSSYPGEPQFWDALHNVDLDLGTSARPEPGRPGTMGCGSRSAPHHAPEWPQPYGHLGGPRPAGRRHLSQGAGFHPSSHLMFTLRRPVGCLFLPSPIPHFVLSNFRRPFSPSAAGHISKSRIWFWLASILTVVCVLLGAQARKAEEQARLLCTAFCDDMEH